MSPVNLSRRGLLGGLGGLVLGLHLPGCRALLPPLDGTLSLGAEGGPPVDVTAWVRVSADDVVTLRVGASEMGQGVFTSLPMLLAEELDVPWAAVRAETAPAHEAYRRPNADFPGERQLTAASESIRGHWDLLREAGAAARAMLVGAAAERWGVRAEDCAVVDGVVRCGEQRASYGELAEAAALRPVPSRVTPKPRAAWTLLGTSPPRLDLPPKVDGSAVFGVDVAVPGALVATLAICPHVGGRLAAVDDSAATAMPGVHTVLHHADAVVVVADTFWRAKRALDAVRITWDPGPHAALDGEAIYGRLRAAVDQPQRVVFREGKPGDCDITAVYEAPYLEHAPMEPLNATVHVQADRCDVWAPTQGQQPTQAAAAERTGLPLERVFVHTPFLGGGFGRRSEVDFIERAVDVAMAVGGPVKLIWTREATFARGYRRPAFACRLSARLGADGLPVAWKVRLAGANILARFVPPALADLKALAVIAHEGLAELPYAIHDREVEWDPAPDVPVPVGFWRSVAASHNGFFRECFIDELAAAAGRDPVEYRRALLAESPRHLATLDAAVAGAGALPEGRHRGVALFECFGSIVAQVADVSVVDSRLTVHRVSAAIDCGPVVHPDTVKAQVEGSIGMGLSEALGGGLDFAGGAVVQQNFHQYPLMKLAAMPEVVVEVVASTHPRPGGVGEPGLPPIAPAVCNAIARATGERVRSLPLARSTSLIWA